MTIREGAVLSEYTGILVCETFSPVNEYIEGIMERPVWTHEIPMLADEIKERSRKEFEEIIKTQTL